MIQAYWPVSSLCLPGSRSGWWICSNMCGLLTWSWQISSVLVSFVPFVRECHCSLSDIRVWLCFCDCDWPSHEWIHIYVCVYVSYSTLSEAVRYQSGLFPQLEKQCSLSLSWSPSSRGHHGKIFMPQIYSWTVCECQQERAADNLRSRCTRIRGRWICRVHKW